MGVPSQAQAGVARSAARRAPRHPLKAPRARGTRYGAPFRALRVQAIRGDYKLKSRYDRLRARGLLTVDEMATKLAVSTTTSPHRASRVATAPLFHACRRHYTGRTGRCPFRSLPGRWQPSPANSWRT